MSSAFASAASSRCDDLGDVADLAHHALGRVEGDALAVVVEGQDGEVLPALGALGQGQRVQQQVRHRLDVVAQALGQRLRQRHQLLQAVRQQQLRHALLVVAAQRRGLRHQRLQLGQRNVDAATVQLERPAGQVVDVPRRIGRQHVVDQVGAGVGRALGRLHRPAELGRAAFVAPGQAGLAHRAGLQRIQQAIAHVGPRVRPQQLALRQQLSQQDGADLALRLGGAGALVRPAAHGDEETHQVLVVAFQVSGRRRQQRKHFAHRAGRGHVAVRAQARLAQADCDVAAAAGRRHDVNKFVLDSFGVGDFGGQLGLGMCCRFDPLQPAQHRGRQGWRACRRSSRRCLAGVVAMKINCVHGSHESV
jgi:hypothetical protein